MRLQDFKTGDRVRVLTGPRKGQEGWIVLPPELMSQELLKGVPWPGNWVWVPVMFTTHFPGGLQEMLWYIRNLYPLVEEDGHMQKAAADHTKYIFAPYHLEALEVLSGRTSRVRRGRPHKMKGPQLCLDSMEV